MSLPQPKNAAEALPEQADGALPRSMAGGASLALAARDGVSLSPPSRRVAFVIEALTVGGAEQMVVGLANRCRELGWDVHVICLTRRGELATRLHERIGVHVLDKRPRIDPRLPPRLRRLIDRLRPDVVNCHLWVANFWTRVSLVASGVPVIASEHSRDSWKPWHYRLLDRGLAPLTHALVAVSEDTASFYRQEIGLRDDLVRVVTNGVETSRFATCDGRALREGWAPDGELLIGTVGRLVAAKNHGRLLEMLVHLVAAGHDRVRLVIVGDGPGREALERRIEALVLGERVVLAGQREDVPDVMAAFDVFVLSSDREGHPLTALEAQAAGTPVVLTDVGGSAEAIARDSTGIAAGDTELTGGLLVAPDAEALAAAVGWLVERPVLRARMGAFARRHAFERFDREGTVSAYVTLFERAAAGCSASRSPGTAGGDGDAG